MIECFSPEVRDYLPDLVHGRLGEIDTATMLAHIEACDACAAEVRLLRAIRQEPVLAPSIDAARIVAALPAPKVVPAVEAPAPAPRRTAAWKFVATAAVVLVAAVAGTRLLDDPAQIGLPVTQSTATAEAGSTVTGVSETGQALAMVAVVDDLTDDQLEQLLGELESIETIPSAEPEVAAVGVGQDLGAAQ